MRSCNRAGYNNVCTHFAKHSLHLQGRSTDHSMAASIEIRNFLGDVETRTLSKNQPVSIGRHRTNDVSIDEEDVAPLHCRISWNKSGYEVVAANPQGVEVNGTIVQHAPLIDGDVVRVGTVDVAIHSDESPVVAAGSRPLPSSDEIRLSPISEEGVVFPGVSPRARGDEFETKPPKKEKQEAEESESAKEERSRKSKSRSERRRREKKKEKPEKEERLDKLFAELESDSVAGKPMIERNTDNAGDIAKESAPKEASAAGRLKSLRGRPTRPGEQDIVRSPLVIFLLAGGLVLLLAAATIFLIIGRETSQSRYDDAVAHMNEGKYTQSIKEFDSFINDFPRHRLTPLARLGRDKSKIESRIAGATPSWELGLSELQDLIERQRDRPNFDDLHPTIVGYAGRIAEGAASAAEATKKREFLKLSADGTRILERYSPLDDPPHELQNRIAEAVRSAEKAIERHETYHTAIETIETSVDSDPLQGLEIRRRLLNRYPEFATDKKLAQLVEACLEAERLLVVRGESELEPITADSGEESRQPLSLTLHQRVRTGEVSSGEVVFALAKDCCYGIDAVTGEPLWRRVIGLDTPFFPIRVATSVPGLLLFNTNDGELVLLEERTGDMVWRQPLTAGGVRPASAPLVHEGQIYLPSVSQQLSQVDAETGSVATQLTFPQALRATPVLDTAGQRMFVAGDRDVIYTLSMRPLDCQSVSYLNHQAGALKAPLVTMGSLLLLSENDRQDSSRLRALDAADTDGRLKQLAETRVAGHVDSRPIMYGNRLFVPFGQERIAIYSVSDEEGQEPLRLIARHDATSDYQGKTWLLAGADGHFWMAGSALRHFELKTDTVVVDPRELAVGLSTQPLQMLNRNLYAGRRLPYNQAVLFTQADREAMAGNWRTVLGSAPLAFGGATDGSLTCVTESGDVFRISAGDIDGGGFKRSSTARLDVHEATTQPLRATTLPDGRLAVASGQPDPALWIVNTAGQLDVNLPIEQQLEADPVLIDAGAVLPIPGRLHLIRTIASSPVEDYLPPGDMEHAHRWAFLMAIDTTHMLACDTAGTLTKIQFREEPVPHLAEVTRVTLDSPTDVRPRVDGARILLVDRGEQLKVIDVLTLETTHSLPLSGPPTALYWPSRARAVVETGSERLACFALQDDPQQVWTLDPKGGGLSGAPVVSEDGMIIALRNGDVIELELDSGKERRRYSVGQPLTSGPIQFGSFLIVTSIDGSLHRIEFDPVAPD